MISADCCLRPLSGSCSDLRAGSLCLMYLTFYLACRFLTCFWYAQRLKQVTLHASRMRSGDSLQRYPRKFPTPGEVQHSFRSPDLISSRWDWEKNFFGMLWGLKPFHLFDVGCSFEKMKCLQWMAMWWPWRFLAPTNMKLTGLSLWPQLPSALRVVLCGPKACLKIPHVPLPSIFLSVALSVACSSLSFGINGYISTYGACVLIHAVLEQGKDPGGLH